MKKFFNLFNDGKFVVALITIITGILGLFNISDNMVGCIGSVLAILLPSIGYIVVSGAVDLQQIGQAISDILTLIENYRKSTQNPEGEENTVDTQEAKTGASITTQNAEDTLEQIETILKRIAVKL